MKRSPLRTIEFCVYLLIIIAAIIYVIVTGNKPTPFVSPPETSAVQMYETSETTSVPPSFYVPKSEFFPEK